jgi:hypothetical protein
MDGPTPGRATSLAAPPPGGTDREPVAAIANPVAKNASLKGPPFTSRYSYVLTYERPATRWPNFGELWGQGTGGGGRSIATGREALPL